MYDFNGHKEADRKKSDDVLCLERQINEVIVNMDSTLQQEMVERMVSATCCSEMKSDVQEVIGYEATNDPSKDGLVYKSVNPGYYWKLPYILKAKINDDGSEIKTYNFLIRPEQVIVYKLINN